MGNKFLALAYAFVWAAFLLYNWNLGRRQARLRQELEELRKPVQEQPPSTTPPI